jgi:predicted transcriptional regulator
MVAGDDWDCRVIEVAHGVQNRNTFIKLDDLEEWKKKQPDDIDLYSSFFRYYTDDPNLGAVLAGFGMDFDDEQNPERARKEALAVAKYLMDRFDIKEFDISIAFSGNKGFHIFVNRRVFGIEPHYWLHKIFKGMAEELIKTHGLKTLDLKIYDRRRLIRLMNSRHSKSGLHKIPLTLTELEKLNVDKIRSLAVRPRPITPRVEHVFSEKAHNWFIHHKELVERQLNEKRAEFSSEDLKDIDVLPCVKKRLEVGAKEGERNLCTWQLASYFCKRGLSLNECLKIMRDWWARVEQGLSPFTWEECERSIRKVFEVGGYLIGCGSEFIEPFCAGKDKCPIFVKKRAEEEIPKEVIDRAREILESGDPLAFIADTVNKIHAGDREIIQLAYLSALSGRFACSMEEAFHIWPIGRSQIGKTHVLYSALNVLPRDYYEVFTSVSPLSLFYYAKKYGEDSLKGKLIFIDEFESSRMALPIIRVLTGQSDIEPRHLSVHEAELLDLKIKGPRSVWISSVKVFGGEQERNRFTFVNPDESSEQDERIYEMQKRRARGVRIEPSEDFDFKIARAITKIINEETKNLTVIIPYIDFINWPFKERRWLFNIFQTIIMTIARVNYRRRRVESGCFLLAEIEDYEVARRLWNAAAQQIIFRVSRTAQKILEILSENPEEAKTREELAEETGLSTERVREILNELAEAHLINKRNRERDGRGRRSKEYWKIKIPALEAIRIGEIKVADAYFSTGISPISQPQNQILDFKLKTFLSQEGSNRFSGCKIGEIQSLKPTGNPLLFLYRRVPPSEKCEFCGAHPVEYEVAIEDAVLRRCPACFENMRRQFKKVEFREARADGC